MATNFPIHLTAHFEADSAGGLRVMQRQFDTTDPRSHQETIGGEAVIGTYGTHLWFGNVLVTPMHSALMRKLESKVRALLRGDARFYVGDLMDDPVVGLTGIQTLGSVNTTNNHRIRIDGLPAGFKLNPGVRFHFDYDNGRRALHEINSEATASAGGQATVDVFPMLEPGWVLGATLTVGPTAACKAYLLPKSLKSGVAGPNNTEGFSFSWRQTMER